MAVAVTVSLLTMRAPVSVQVSVTGLTVGAAVTVVGVTAAGDTWDVPGGVLVVTGPTLLLTDNRAPLNGPLTYRVLVGGAVYTSAPPVVVPFAGPKTVLQTLDGTVAVPVRVSGMDPRSGTTRTASYAVSGRTNPPTRWDVAGATSGIIVVVADQATSVGLTALLASGMPVVRRNTPGFQGVAPAELIQITGVSHHLYSNFALEREWSLPFIVIDDPEPSVAAIAFTWDNFDTVYAATTWSAWDTEWATQTWDRFDAYDWGQRL